MEGISGRGNSQYKGTEVGRAWRVERIARSPLQLEQMSGGEDGRR